MGALVIALWIIAGLFVAFIVARITRDLTAPLAPSADRWEDE